MTLAVASARTYGDDSTIVGFAAAGIRPTQRPNAAACCSPNGDSGVSTSRVAMSISGKPAASAASRATLPALCPWRTIHNCCGDFCSIVRYNVLWHKWKTLWLSRGKFGPNVASTWVLTKVPQPQARQSRTGQSTPGPNPYREFQGCEFGILEPWAAFLLAQCFCNRRQTKLAIAR